MSDDTQAPDWAPVTDRDLEGIAKLNAHLDEVRTDGRHGLKRTAPTLTVPRDSGEPFVLEMTDGYLEVRRRDGDEPVRFQVTVRMNVQISPDEATELRSAACLHLELKKGEGGGYACVRCRKEVSP